MKRTTSEYRAALSRALDLARQGEFLKLDEDRELHDTLMKATKAKGHIVPKATSLKISAVLAELHDQLGQYQKARQRLRLAKGDMQLRFLEQACSPKDGKRLEEELVNARSMLILQHGVLCFRKGDPHAAQKVFSKCEGLLKTLVFQQVEEESLCYSIRVLLRFWLGRVQTSVYEFKEAEESFVAAMELIDQSMEARLGHASSEKSRPANSPDLKSGAKDSPPRRDVLAERHAGYLIATCLGFGFGQLRQMQGKFRDSMHHVRMAIPLFRFAGDTYRHGYCRYLLGVAHRAKQADFSSAEKYLKEAEVLFGGKGGKGGHWLHRARVRHQLAMLMYDQFETDGSGRDHAMLGKGADYLRDAIDDISSFKNPDFHDPLLVFGIQITGVHIDAAIGNFEDSRKKLRLAREMINCSLIPKNVWAQADLAEGHIHYEAARRQNQPGESGRDDLIEESRKAFVRASESSAARKSDRAAAYLRLARLFVLIGDASKALKFYHEAEDLLSDEEHGWVLHLASKVKSEIPSDTPVTVDIPQLLMAAAELQEAPVKYVGRVIEDRWRAKLLEVVDASVVTGSGEAAKARFLGIHVKTLERWRQMYSHGDSDEAEHHSGGKANRIPG